MTRLAILGAGGHGVVVADAALGSGWQEIEFFDDQWPHTTKDLPWPVVGTSHHLKTNWCTFDGVCVAIGNNSLRLQFIKELMILGAPVVTIMHPRAVVSQYASIGLGSVVFAGAIVNPLTTIGLGAIINTGATVDHDCYLEDGVHLCPGVHLAGGVSIGAHSTLGIGSAVKHLITIGSNVMVGAGAAVVNNIKSNSLVVGVPARER